MPTISVDLGPSEIQSLRTLCWNVFLAYPDQFRALMDPNESDAEHLAEFSRMVDLAIEGFCHPFDGIAFADRPYSDRVMVLVTILYATVISGGVDDAPLAVAVARAGVEFGLEPTEAPTILRYR